MYVNLAPNSIGAHDLPDKIMALCFPNIFAHSQLQMSTLSPIIIEVEKYLNPQSKGNLSTSLWEEEYI